MKKLLVISFLSVLAYTALSNAYDKAHTQVVKASEARHQLIANI